MEQTFKKLNATPEFNNCFWDEIESIDECDEGECYDICLLEEDVYLGEPNFIANDFVVHNSGLHETFCRRKRGQEKYEIHPLLEDILRPTYNCLCYQEQIMKILHVVGKIPLKDCEAVRKAISKKKVEGFLKYKKIFIANGKITLGWTEDELEKFWKQIEFFSGYCFNSSHSVAYTYISSRMLYLKAHHPVEFYTSFLSQMKCAGPEDYQKLKDYKLDAERHGVEVMPIDLNKSDENFSIVNDKVYFGFSNLRGVGEEVGRKIVDGQPYAGIEDFLQRFGTDSKPVMALISLGAFGEDRRSVYHYYLAFKKYEQRRRERQIRFDKTMKCVADELMLYAGLTEFPDVPPDQMAREVRRLKDRKERAQKARQKWVNDSPPTLENFVSRYTESVEVVKDKKVYELLTDREEAEKEFYGFVWRHPLEKCPGYRGDTMEKLIDSGAHSGPIEVLIRKVHTKKTKTQRTFYSLEAEDANSEVKWITVWAEDFKRWESEFRMGNMISVRVTPPGEFRSFTMEPHPNRWRPPSKENDLRVKVLYEKPLTNS